MNHRTQSRLIVLRLCLILPIFLFPLFAEAQKADSPAKFGLELSTKVNGEVYPLRLVSTYYYQKGKHQLEWAFGFHPFIRKEQEVVSSELNYKYFPNSVENKFNMYLITSLDYVYHRRESFYPATYQYLYLNGGYGFQVQAFGGAYVGTNILAGAFTSSKRSENPYNGNFGSRDMFEEFGVNIVFQFNIGYRF